MAAHDKDPIDAAVKAYLDDQTQKADQLYPTTEADLARFREALKKDRLAPKLPEESEEAEASSRNWHSLFYQAVLPLAAVLVIGLVLWSVWVPAEFRDRTAARGAERGGKPSLPDRLRADFEKGTIRFVGKGIEMAGTMKETNASPEAVVFEVVVSGKDTKGVEGTFAGEASFTRAVPGHPLKRLRDAKEITVIGTLRITGGGSYPEKRTYMP